jgi:hypothetical protein
MTENEGQKTQNEEGTCRTKELPECSRLIDYSFEGYRADMDACKGLKYC